MPLGASREGPNNMTLDLFMAKTPQLYLPQRAPRIGRCHQLAQRRLEARLDSFDSRFAAVVVDEQPMPYFQCEHQPDPLLPVNAAVDMIADDRTHHVRVVVTAAQAAIGEQHIIQQASPRSDKPAGQWNSEA